MTAIARPIRAGAATAAIRVRIAVPHWANDGRGYNATWYSDGRPPSLTGVYSYDATLNGRPCIPHPTYYGSGYP